MKTLAASIALALCCAAPVVAGAQEAAAQLACRSRPAEPPDRPRIGLALGGGGARGVAHISVLRKLEELRVPVDCIAGTSMGALVGALYASGMSVDEIERLVLTMDWGRLFDDSLARAERSFRRKRDDELVIGAPGIGIGRDGVKLAAGLLAGERILLTFEKLVEPVATIEDFDQLPIPYRAVAADINDGAPVVIDRGDLALAMRASMSIPGVFPPVAVGDRVVVDGGVARNLPIDIVRSMGADVVVAVDVGTPLAAMTPQSSLLAITGQVTGLLTVRNTKEQIATLTERDVLIQPQLGEEVATADFGKGKEALAIGKRAADDAAARLAALAPGGSAYEHNVATRTGRATAPPVIEFVRLDNRSRYSDELLLARIDVPVGKPLDSARLEASLQAVHGFNTLSLSTYEIVEEDERIGVVLHVSEKVQGPNYLEAGVSASGDFEGRFDFGVRLGLIQSPINARGGELRYLLKLGDESGFLTEYYQPLDLRGSYFFGAKAEYRNRPIGVFGNEGDQIAEYGVAELGGVLVAGREFGNFGAVTLGVLRFTGDAELEIGQAGLPDVETDTGEAFVEATIDRLDSFFFPREGCLARTRYTFSRDALGADLEYEQFDFDGIVAQDFGDHSLQLGLRYHATTSGTAPLQSLYRAGGFSRLVGFQPNEISGQHFATLLGGYSYQMGKMFGQEALVGGLVEYGNVWQDRSEMKFDNAVLNASAYVGIDSWIGPILFGIGGRESGEYNLFLEVGHRF